VTKWTSILFHRVVSEDFATEYTESTEDTQRVEGRSGIGRETSVQSRGPGEMHGAATHSERQPACFCMLSTLNASPSAGFAQALDTQSSTDLPAYNCTVFSIQMSIVIFGHRQSRVVSWWLAKGCAREACRRVWLVRALAARLLASGGVDAFSRRLTADAAPIIREMSGGEWQIAVALRRRK
jgi:hypothetical protein